jgi:hypothetical protein
MLFIVHVGPLARGEHFLPLSLSLPLMIPRRLDVFEQSCSEFISIRLRIVLG